MRWAQYAVKKARYNKRGSRIEKVSIHTIHNGILGPRVIWPRESLLHVLEKGSDVIVVPPGKNIDDLDRRKVRHLSLNREGYIRVDSGEVTADYLGDLPVM